MKRRLCLALVLLATEAHGADRDRWIAKDKMLHASASTSIAMLGYAGSTAFIETRGHSLLFAAGLTLAIGAAKETLDYTGLGDPSWKDFAWDAIGTVAGTALAWSMDLFVNGVSAARPLFGRRAQATGFVLRF